MRKFIQSHRQSITTKYHGPTDTKGSRISATSGSGMRIYIPYDHSLNSTELHKKAADKLIQDISDSNTYSNDLNGIWIGAQQKNADTYIWVLVPHV